MPQPFLFSTSLQVLQQLLLLLLLLLLLMLLLQPACLLHTLTKATSL
jgi:hypothetical protein